MSEFSLIVVLQKKQENPTIDMAKIQIKSERLTPFGGLFSIMEQFDSTLSSIVYCLKSHCGVRGYCRQKWVLQVQIICKFSNERTCKRNKDVQGLSCGFEADKRNFGFWIDSDYTMKDYCKLDIQMITEQEFNNLWNSVDYDRKKGEFKPVHSF